MIEIDGSEGGGQILRNSLALSAVTAEDFVIENIRGSRPNPGLKRQHLESVKAAGRICRAEVEGLEDGSERLVFRPGELNVSSFTANIGTAGSVTLLIDTLLPITTQFDKDFRLTVKGGTDVKWSPTAPYFQNVKIPLLEKYGLNASVETVRTGFYPKGGGQVRLETKPFSLEEIELVERGSLERFEIFSKVSSDLERRDVADRQASEVMRMLKNSHISVPIDKKVEYVDTASTGSSLCLKAVYEDSIAGFDILGERDRRAEELAQEIVQEFKSFHSTDSVVDKHMSDQLVIFLALAGGKVAIPKVTNHVKTAVEVCQKFGKEVEIVNNGAKTVLEA